MKKMLIICCLLFGWTAYSDPSGLPAINPRAQQLPAHAEQSPRHGVSLYWFVILGGWSIIILFICWNLQLKREIRQRRKTESDLKKMEALKDNLMHMIVHDMRVPLTVISGSLELLASPPDPLQPENPDSKYLRMAQTSSKTLTRMVQTLLDTCRLESDQLPINRQQVDLRLVAEKAVQIMESHARPANQRLILSGESAIGHIDPELIERVLTNLIGNAIKASSEKDVIEIRTADSAAALIVEVCDYGPGIPKEYQQRIFEKFTSVESGDRRHLASIGLGLTFCKMAIEAHGGSIGVQSEEGRGSTFRFEIPKVRPQTAGTP